MARRDIHSLVWELQAQKKALIEAQRAQDAARYWVYDQNGEYRGIHNNQESLRLMQDKDYTRRQVR